MTNLYVVANSRRRLEVKFLLHGRDSSSCKMMDKIHRKTRRWAYTNSNTLALNAKKKRQSFTKTRNYILVQLSPRVLLCKEASAKRGGERDLCRRGRALL